MSDDPIDAVRRALIHGMPIELQAQVDAGQQTWDTTELQRDFEVLGYLAPFVSVRRRADGTVGTLLFTHQPRVYFSFMEDGTVTTILERRLAHFIMTDQRFTADDVTDNGAITAAGDHDPNAKQSTIGALFQAHSRQGHINFTGVVVRSTAKHRKGGMIRVWEGTQSGRRWAAGVQ